MSTIRGVKDRRFKFVQLLNEMFEDPKLSLKAKGFIGFCLTKTENWEFHISHLCSVLKEGETAIYSVINECIENGYAYRYQERGKDGKMLQGNFVISDSKSEIFTIKNEHESRPGLKKCLPHRGFTDAVNSDAINPPPSNTNISNMKEKQQQAAVFSSENNQERKHPKKLSDSNNQHSSSQDSEKGNITSTIGRTFNNKNPDNSKKVYPILDSLQIPEVDKIELTKKYTFDEVDHAIKWATHSKTKLTKGLAPALKWACKNKPQLPVNEKPKEKTLKECSSHNRNYFTQINKVACENGFRLHSYGFREVGDYIETDNSKIYFKDISFLEQICNFFRKKGIDNLNIFKIIKVCQNDLQTQ